MPRYSEECLLAQTRAYLANVQYIEERSEDINRHRELVDMANMGLLDAREDYDQHREAARRYLDIIHYRSGNRSVHGGNLRAPAQLRVVS